MACLGTETLLLMVLKLFISFILGIWKHFLFNMKPLPESRQNEVLPFYFTTSEYNLQRGYGMENDQIF